MKCPQPACTGSVVDGYCDVCGLAPSRNGNRSVTGSAASNESVRGSAQTAAAGTTITRRTTGTARSTGSTRRRLGAGLVEVPPIPFRDPSEAVLNEPDVEESRRFCARCDGPVGRARDGSPGRIEGFCPNCGAPFSFRPKLQSGDLVAGQYEVAGCLAHGGMGWVYLAKDHNVSDRWVVLKGLLNTADEAAMAAALAERRFLAEVEHPNIVKIFNFVQHDASGYIVMEYVGGASLKQIMVSRRETNGGKPDPLPVAQAIAYMLEILPALGYLHDAGLLFCDFKLDNAIQTQHSLKLIDLGGVYRMDDRSSPVYGTVGYQAPEITETGPTIASDLFTVARTLAVMCIDFKGYQSKLRYTLPPRDEVPLFVRFDSLYRFLLKGTAPNPDDRFQSADEMADQLFGVLREIVATLDGVPVPAASKLFTGELRSRADRPHWDLLPLLQVSAEDLAAGYLATLAATEPIELIELLRTAPVQTIEVDLRLARALIDAGDLDAASEAASAIERSDPWEWRAAWYRGIAELASGRPDAALVSLKTVYEAVPGELAPKLALGVAAESAGDIAGAAVWYDVVSTTDPAYTTATFGLARCRHAAGDLHGALAAYERVAESSSSYTDARVASVRCLIDGSDSRKPELAHVLAAAAALENLALDGEQRSRLTLDVLLAGLELVEQGNVAVDRDELLLGSPLNERELRFAVERGYRNLARHAADKSERIRLVDEANEVRPTTWT